MSEQNPQKTVAFPSLQVVFNLILHSLLMVALPLSLYFASDNGNLDFLYARTVGIPSTKHNRSILSAFVAVVAVNLVVASFVIRAFMEQTEEDKKKKDKKDN
mmetsp:Transcript_29463/g.54076  ORF Transcript_29463/g.54076 Transcript_29463/m.54076 type:complete len:102 (+) Transcript_29463:55-360(+)